MTNDEGMTNPEVPKAYLGEEELWCNQGEGARVGEEAPHVERRAFDLEERTARFGEAIVAFAKRNDEGRMMKLEFQGRVVGSEGVSEFVIRASFVIRHSSFVIYCPGFVSFPFFNQTRRA